MYVSVHHTTAAYFVPSHTRPLSCVEPKPVPSMPIVVPAGPLVVERLVMTGVMTVKGMELLQTPPCCTWALPDLAPEATAATISVLLPLTIDPARLLPR